MNARIDLAISSGLTAGPDEETARPNSARPNGLAHQAVEFLAAMRTARLRAHCRFCPPQENG
ncbi:hypothetical protein [Saccharopolyspora rosea]|uniref:Uncharacterized protein n=1 Tax=Saccharopolyspora rosea TaxID=524884 RepID=A0ABW3FTS4_9PSEU|nr:hypothetical protein [Saccharopolyspora rosea]